MPRGVSRRRASSGVSTACCPDRSASWPRAKPPPDSMPASTAARRPTATTCSRGRLPPRSFPASPGPCAAPSPSPPCGTRPRPASGGGTFAPSSPLPPEKTGEVRCAPSRRRASCAVIPSPSSRSARRASGATWSAGWSERWWPWARAGCPGRALGTCCGTPIAKGRATAPRPSGSAWFGCAIRPTTQSAKRSASPGQATAAKSAPSTRSSMPPWPGIERPVSFLPAARFQ